MLMKYIFVIFIAMLEFEMVITGGRDNGLRCPPVTFPNGKVRTRGRGKILRYQCFEGFTLIGNKYSTCVRGKWDTQTPVCVNSQCRDLPTPEHALVASKYDGAILIYFCAPGYVLVGSAEIYCNGRQWNSTAPYCRDSTAVAPLKCDFEKPDLCWWEQDPKHDFDWRRHNFETPSAHIGTGPTHDHTLGSGNDGYYLYIEASGRLVNDTARIISPLYNASLTNSGCFSFWYHMYGTTIGTLRIYFKPEFGANDSQVMFAKMGNQGNRWLHGFFYLPKTTSSFQIIIEGIRGTSYVSDIAIDDVAILQGDECLQLNQSVSIGTTDSTTVDQNDQIEIVNELQSCRGRCDNDKTMDTLTTIIPLSSPDACHCNIDCADNSTCCPDFAEYCVLDVTDTPFISSSTEKSVTKEYVNIITTLSEPKDELEPYNNTGMREPITYASVDKITQSQTPISSTNKIHHVATTESHISKKHLQQLDNTPGIGLFLVACIVVVFVVLAIIIAIAIVFMTKRNKSYKRGAKSSKGSGLAEDSDVRFLTSDEILDFNLARPMDNEDA